MTLPSPEGDPAIRSVDEHIRELENLREALSLGLVDGFVVGSSDDQKRVLLLSGAYSRYRRLVEEMEQGAVTITTTGEILFVNRSFAQLVGASPAELFRRSLFHLVASSDHGALEALLSGLEGHREIEIRRSDGRRRRARFSATRDYDDFTTIIVTDLTRSETLHEAADALGALRSGRVDGLVDDAGHVFVLDPERTVRIMVELKSIAGELRASFGALSAAPRDDAKAQRAVASLGDLADRIERMAASLRSGAANV
jgi:PAS domain S-box-containing protein